MSPSGVWISASGAAEIEAALEKVGADAERILEEAARAGAEVIRAEAARNAPRDTTSLSKSIETKTTEKSKTKVEVAIGPDVAQKKGFRGGIYHFYGLFQEYGVDLHFVGGKGVAAVNRRARKKRSNLMDSYLEQHRKKHPGHKAQPFMRPALDSKQAEAQDKIAEVLKRELGL